MSDNAAAANPAPAGEAKPKGSIFPLITMALVVVNLAATGFVAVKIVKMPPPGAPAAHAEAAGGAEGEEEGGGGEQEGKGGNAKTVVLDSFIVNLNEPESTRYLKTSLEVQLATVDAANLLTKSKSAVRDEALRYLSGLTVADTLGEANKKKIRDEIAARLEHIVGAGRLKKVYFSEFVVQ